MMENKKFKPTQSAASMEHWLTLCACTSCGETPDVSPIYKCSMGHPQCYPCFKKLVQKGLPVCGTCNSDSFTRQDVSEDFLRKLKNKPGIGRPRRYPLDSAEGASNVANDNKIEKPAVTVEQLFKMPSSKIQELLSDKTREKLRAKKPGENITALERHMNQPDSKNEIPDEEACAVDPMSDKLSKICVQKPYAETSTSLMNTDNSATPMPSKKPLKCPHDHCNKIIAVSAFQAHFDYEHSEFQRHSVERGKELVLVFDSAIIEHGRSLCLAILNVYEKHSSLKTLTDTFWLMVSGSRDHRPRHAFAIFWLLTGNDEKYQSTIELAAHQEKMACSTFCATNGVHESQTIRDVISRCNCHFVTQGTLRSMLCYGPLMKLRIKIH